MEPDELGELLWERYGGNRPETAPSYKALGRKPREVRQLFENEELLGGGQFRELFQPHKRRLGEIAEKLLEEVFVRGREQELGDELRIILRSGQYRDWWDNIAEGLDEFRLRRELEMNIIENLAEAWSRDRELM